MIAEIYKIFKENNYATIGVCIYLFFILDLYFAIMSVFFENI